MVENSDNSNWMDEIDRFADEILGDQSGSSCDQVHPIIKAWYENFMSGEPPDSRPSVAQAMSCLATELVNDMPEVIFQAIEEHLDEDDVALWIQEVILIGRAFEQALRNGTLDDL